jgi:hypothetical protein
LWIQREIGGYVGPDDISTAILLLLKPEGIFFRIKFSRVESRKFELIIAVHVNRLDCMPFIIKLLTKEKELFVVA